MLELWRWRIIEVDKGSMESRGMSDRVLVFHGQYHRLEASSYLLSLEQLAILIDSVFKALKDPRRASRH